MRTAGFLLLQGQAQMLPPLLHHNELGLAAHCLGTGCETAETPAMRGTPACAGSHAQRPAPRAAVVSCAVHRVGRQSEVRLLIVPGPASVLYTLPGRRSWDRMAEGGRFYKR